MSTDISPPLSAISVTPRIPAARAWLMVALLFLCQALNSMDKLVIGLAALPIMRELNLSPAQYGLVASSFYFLYAASGVVFALFVADKLNSKWMLVVLVSIWSLSQLPVALASSVWLLVACRVALGVGEGPGTPTVLNACYGWFPNDSRSLPSSLVLIGTAFGGILGAPFLTYVIITFGWRAAFVVCSALGVIWLVLWIALGKEGPLNASVGKAKSQGVDPDALPGRIFWLDRVIVGNLIVGFCAYWIQGLVGAWANPYLQQALNFTPQAAGTATGLLQLAPALLLLVVPAISQVLLKAKFSARFALGWVNTILMFAAAACLFAIPLIHSPTLKLVLLALGAGLPVPSFVLGPAMIARVAPDRQRIKALLMIYSLVTVAGIISPLVAGQLIQTAPSIPDGYNFTFLITAALTAAGGVAGALCLNPERTRARFDAVRTPAPSP